MQLTTGVPLLALAIVAAAASGPETATSPVASPGCESITAADLSTIPDAPTQITESKRVEAAGFLPAQCRVEGYVAPQVGFVLRLPLSSWNGRFLSVGCGGTCGSLELQSKYCDGPLAKGYACLVCDTGHRGNGLDALWGYQNLPAKIDFAYRAIHVVALAGKAITERFYSTAPQKSYFMGCSEGGRQALVEAERFPWDFDGILAGAPGLNETGYYMDMVWDLRVVAGPDGRSQLAAKDLELVHRAALAACDRDDGIADRIIGSPQACRFDVSVLICKGSERNACLTPSQAGVVKKIYDGPTTSTGTRLTAGGPSIGSELNWIEAFVGRDAVPPWATAENISDPLRYLAFLPDAGGRWKPSDFDFDKDYQRLELMESLYSAANPDLRKFKAAGSKLIVYQGWNDIFAPPAETIDYYDTVVRTMGGHAATEDFFRLFMLPGVDHCSGGAGADAADLLGELEAWVEHGQAPDRILLAHTEGEPGFFYPYHPFPSNAAHIRFTRPAYPYPLRAIYKGNGDPSNAANFFPAPGSTR
jgi:hypothetical protein